MGGKHRFFKATFFTQHLCLSNLTLTKVYKMNTHLEITFFIVPENDRNDTLHNKFLLFKKELFKILNRKHLVENKLHCLDP